MKKTSLFFLLLLAVTGAMFGQASGNTVKLICKITDPPADLDSLTLYEYAGLTSRPVQKAIRQADNVYTFTLPSGKPRFYAVGQFETSVARVILGEEPEVKMYALAIAMNRGRTLGSNANAAYEGMIKRCDAFENAPGYDAATEKNKMAYLDSLKKVNNLLWHSATLRLSPRFDESKGGSAIDFVGQNHFKYANIAGDRAYDDIPEVYAAFTNFVIRLNGLGAAENQIKNWADQLLSKIPAESRAYRMALGGLINGARESKIGPLMLNYSERYVERYKNDNYGEIDRLRYEVGQASTSTPGMIAPDLKGMTPDSSKWSLYQMRGSVVLIDFWASWCGPCRRENPNVKAMYAKYHDKGFDVLGVSLDRTYEPWVKAIEADGLAWRHISDLKGWQSEHAALYAVTSIPQTLLIDRNGKIIQRNLRGEGLQQKLKEIFGE